MSGAFLNTNVLLYAFSRDDDRSVRARELLDRGGVVSVQCLNEFASVARRKLQMEWERIDEAIGIIVWLCTFVMAIELTVHRIGLAIAQRHRTSIYDGMIVAAAITAGCDVLWSEDMHPGLVVGGQLRIENPFTAT